MAKKCRLDSDYPLIGVAVQQNRQTGGRHVENAHDGECFGEADGTVGQADGTAERACYGEGFESESRKSRQA